MVGIVLVSHSRALAEALVGLVQQISVGKPIRMTIAAGIGPNREEFGTDAAEIAESIQAVSDGSGVAVLMDLGSAILSAEMALDLLPDEIRGQVRLVAAPFVEGAIAAAIQASLGSDLTSVCREAEQALLRKSEQLTPVPAPTREVPVINQPASVTGKSTQVVLTLKNAMGLHARPAAKFVQAAAKFQADVQVNNMTSGKGPVSARSLLSILSLGAVKGNLICITASGPDAQEALDTLTTLVEQTLPGE
jgi:phosphocarrier protein FPr